MSVFKALLTSLSFLVFTAGIIYAQSDTALQTTIQGSDIASASSVTRSWYRILPAATAAATATRGSMPPRSFRPAH